MSNMRKIRNSECKEKLHSMATLWEREKMLKNDNLRAALCVRWHADDADGRR